MGFGSRAAMQRLLKVPDAAFDKLIVDLRADFANEFARVRSYKATEDDIGEDFARAENYLSLVGLVIVILGGIGVSSVTRVFVQQKMQSIAVLKCVGARSSQLLAIYVAQVAVLGLAGSLLGVMLAELAMRAIPSLLAGATPGVEINYALTLPAVLQGLGIGLLVSLLFSLVPLLDVRHVKPSLLLRDEARSHRPDCAADHRHGSGGRRPGRTDRVAGRIAAHRVGGGGRVCRHRDRAAPCRHAADPRDPAAGARAIVRAAPRRAATEPAGQPDANRAARGRPRQLLHHRRALAAAEPDRSVRRQRDGRFAGHVPARYPARSGGGGRGGDRRDTTRAPPPPRLLPVLRARVVGVAGPRAQSRELRRRARPRFARPRIHHHLSPTLEPNEKIVAGADVGRDARPTRPKSRSSSSSASSSRSTSATPFASTSSAASIAAKVTSIRLVEWSDSRAGGFMFVFRPGVIEKAPHSFIGFLRGPQDAAARAPAAVRAGRGGARTCR